MVTLFSSTQHLGTLVTLSNFKWQGAILTLKEDNVQHKFTLHFISLQQSYSTANGPSGDLVWRRIETNTLSCLVLFGGGQSLQADRRLSQPTNMLGNYFNFFPG